MTTRHAAPADVDLSDPMGQAYVNDAAAFLRGIVEGALSHSEPGEQGDADLALALVGLFAGRLNEDEGEAYTMALFTEGAKIIAREYVDLIG